MTIPENAVVWIEVPSNDIDRAAEFYDAVLKTNLFKEETGPNPVMMFPTDPPMQGIAGHIYPGKPAGDGSGPTIHFNSPDKLEHALERVRSAGGQVLSDPIQIPPGRFAYCLDLDGNSISIFEGA